MKYVKLLVNMILRSWCNITWPIHGSQIIQFDYNDRFPTKWI